MNNKLTDAAVMKAKQVSEHVNKRAIAEVIGEFATTFRYESIPESVCEQAKYLLLDAIGIAFASTRFDFANRAYSALLGKDAPTGSVVIGMPGRMVLRDAVLMNSMLVHGLDYDDTYFAGGIHPTASCFPSALGVAVQVGASGREMLAAYVLGIEVATRLGAIAHGIFNQSGLHPSSLLGAFASAVIAGWLMDFNAHQITMAQGIALGMAGGTLESLQDGSWTKRIQPGWAAASGITAALLAQRGFIGSVRAYEGRFGLFAAHLGAHEMECDYEAGTKDLGMSWELSQVALKPYPACHATQAAIEAAIIIAKEHNLKVEDIETIKAIIPKHYVKLVCEPIERKRRPESIYGAQFSIPYTVACSFMHGRFGLSELQDVALTDPHILDLAQKVSYEVDESFNAAKCKTNRPAELVVKMKDGSTLSHKVRKLRGSPDLPMTKAEIVAKFMENTRSVMSETHAEQVLNNVLALDKCATISEFADTLVARGAK